MANNELQVLLTTEGTYPVSRGGVSTWCDLMVQRMPGVRYTVMTVMSHPYMPPCYQLPAAVTRWIKVPLWGTEDPQEHLELGAVEMMLRRQRTTPAVIQGEFLPTFARVVDRFLMPQPASPTDFAADLVRLHQLFLEYDYHSLLKDPAIWRWYAQSVVERFAPHMGVQATLQDMVQSLGWLYRFLVVLATPVPGAHITHASAAAFCALPGVVAKRVAKVPFLLSEHGIYLREQYTGIGRSSLSPFMKRTLLGMVQAVSHEAHAHADVVAPVAAFNARWEEELGVPRQRIRVVYNGVDPEVLRPYPRVAGAPPTVVTVARIDPVKDLETLLKSARLVIDARPEARFVVYGHVAVPTYYDQLLALRERLRLTGQFIFAGHTDNIAAAYASGDVVVLSSITEGFPYAVIEAMMCERPVVATDVGGTREALAHTGTVVPPRVPDAMAEAILRLLNEPAMARDMAAEARERALALFTVQKFVHEYRALYDGLASGVTQPREATRLAVARAQALAVVGEPRQAAGVLMRTVREVGEPRLQALLMLELAQVQLQAGAAANARLALARAEALVALADAAA